MSSPPDLTAVPDDVAMQLVVRQLAEVSLDIIEDKWNIFSQAGVQLAGQWTLCGQAGGCAGQLTFGPVFTVLGTTIQWDLQ